MTSPNPETPSGARSVVCSFKLFQGSVLSLTGLAALFFLVTAVRFLPVTGDNMHPEAANVVIAERWAHGSSLYTDFRQAPYLLTAFPPLWYGALALASRAGVDGVDALTLFGRILNLTSLLCVAILGYLWQRRLGLTPALAVLTPTSLLAFPLLLPWAVTARPDFPMIFFGLFALWLAAFGAGAAGIALAAAAAAVSFLVRHSSVAVPTAIVLWLLWNRRRRHAAIFAAIWAVIVVAVLAPLDVHSGGLVRLNLTGPQFGNFDPRHAHQILLKVVTATGNGFALGLLAFGLFGFVHAWRGDPRIRLVGLYFATSLCFTVLLTMGAGNNVNHYLEPALAWAMLLPIGMDALKRTWVESSASNTLACVLVLVLLLPSLALQRWNMVGAQPPDFRRLAELARHRRVLADVPYVAARSRIPELLDSVPHAYLERAGAWSPDPLVADLDAKAYELVILQRPIDDARWATARYPTVGPQLLSAIARNYAFCFELETQYVYGPVWSTGTRAGRPTCPDPPSP